MARVNHVKKCRKDQGKCSSCGHEIKAGEPYKFVEFAFGPTIKKCGNCSFRRSELTRSEILSTVWDLVDGFVAEGDTPSEIADQLREFADNFRADIVEGMLQEKLDNMEGAGTGLENTPVYQDLEERRDNLEGFCQEVESAADEIESEQDAWNDESEEDKPDLEDLKSQAQDAVNGCPE